MTLFDEGFEAVVRTKLGVSEDDLPDNEINNPMIIGLVEAVIRKRVKDMDLITDQQDLVFLKNAAIAYLCYKLAPSMPARLKIDVQTVDVRWKTDRVDWEKKAEQFYLEYEECLGNISSVSVSSNIPVELMGIAKGNGLPIGE